MAYYENHKETFRTPGTVRVRSILVKAGGARTKEEALALATGILSRLEEGGDFAALAESYSDGPYAESGGDMGWVREGELMDRINGLVFSLDEKDISGILETKLGFHIFKVEEKKPAAAKEFREVKDRIEETLFNKKVEENLGQWIENLKKDAYIAFR